MVDRSPLQLVHWPVGGGGGGGAGASSGLAIVSPPLHHLLGLAGGDVAPLSVPARSRSKAPPYPATVAGEHGSAAPPPRGDWHLSLPEKCLSATLSPPQTGDSWASICVVKGESAPRHYTFRIEPKNGSAEAACARWAKTQEPHKFPGGTANADNRLKGEEPIFSLSVGESDVYDSCQFTLHPNQCTVEIAHLVTKVSARRGGCGTAALVAMLLGGCHLNGELFGAATEGFTVRDATNEVSPLVAALILL